MLRAKKLGSIEFTLNTLFIQEEFSNAKVKGESVMSAGRTHIVYGATILTPYITLDSHEFGWVDGTQKVAIEAMWEAFTTTQVLTYDDDSTVTVRMAVEKKLSFTSLHEGSDLYLAIIPLAKVL